MDSAATQIPSGSAAKIKCTLSSCGTVVSRENFIAHLNSNHMAVQDLAAVSKLYGSHVMICPHCDKFIVAAMLQQHISQAHRSDSSSPRSSTANTPKVSFATPGPPSTSARETALPMTPRILQSAMKECSAVPSDRITCPICSSSVPQIERKQFLAHVNRHHAGYSDLVLIGSARGAAVSRCVVCRQVCLKQGMASHMRKRHNDKQPARDGEVDDDDEDDLEGGLLSPSESFSPPPAPPKESPRPATEPTISTPSAPAGQGIWSRFFSALGVTQIFLALLNFFSSASSVRTIRAATPPPPPPPERKPSGSTLANVWRLSTVLGDEEGDPEAGEPIAEDAPSAPTSSDSGATAACCACCIS